MRDLDQIGLHRIERELERRSLRSDFSPDVEREYIQFVRRQRAGIRTSLFVALFLVYALAPMLQPLVFAIPDQVRDLLFWLQIGVVSPLALVAVGVSRQRSVNLVLARAIQQGAVFAACLMELVQRHFALTHGYSYPPENFMLVILAAATFGGFGPLRIAFGALFFTGLALLQEYRALGFAPEFRGEVLMLLSLAFIAVGGSYTTGRINRRAWLHRSLADLLSRTDALTGLPNRMNFNRLLVRSLSQARREGVAVGAMMLDIDHFKQVNDRYGHLFGDQVLRSIGHIMLEGVARRPLEIKARFGGEEMVAVWYDITPEFLREQAEALQEAIRALRIETPEQDPPLKVTASLGVTWLVPDETLEPEDLLRHADELMYQAKARGRDQLVMAHYRREAPGGPKLTGPGGSGPVVGMPGVEAPGAVEGLGHQHTRQGVR